MTLATGQVTTVERVGGVSLPEESSTWVAMHRGRAGGGAAAAAAAAGAAAGGGGGAEPPAAAPRRRQPARRPKARPTARRAPSARTTAAISSSATSSPVRTSTIPLVSDFAWSKDGSWLAYAVSSAKAEEDGAFARKMSDGTIVTLHKGKGNYKSLAFDEAGTQLAFLSDQAEYDKDVSPYRLYYWKAGDAAAAELVSAATRGMPPGMVVSDQAAPRFSAGRAAALRRHGAAAGAAGAPKARRRRAASTSGTGRIRCCSRCSACARSRSATAPTAPSCTSPTSGSSSSRRRICRTSARARIRRAPSAPPTCRIARRCPGTRPTTTSSLVDLKTGQRQADPAALARHADDVARRQLPALLR